MNNPDAPEKKGGPSITNWKELKAEYVELERRFNEATAQWTAEARSSLWHPAEAFADQAGLHRLRGQPGRANVDLTFAIDHARACVEKVS